MPLDTLLQRIRADDYVEMPGLRLTLDQAQRLYGVERQLCQQVLATLVDTRFLCVKANGAYARVTDGADCLRLQPARHVNSATLTESRAHEAEP